MILTKLHLINFGKFSNHEICFNSSLNIFYGLNEAGKTTIVDAITGVLFGFAGRRDDVKKFRVRYSPKLNCAVYKAGLSAVIDNIGEIYIERDFLNNKAEVFTLQDNGRNLTGLGVQDIVNESLGIKNIQLFRSTMLIRQEEMALLAGAELSDVLTRKITSGAQATSVKVVFGTLGRKYLELNKGLLRNVGNPGPIRQCQDEINKLTEQLESMEEMDKDYEDMRTKAESLEEAIVDLRTKLQTFEDTISAYRKKRELTQVRDNWLERQKIILTKIGNIKQVQDELAEINGYLSARAPNRDRSSEAYTMAQLMEAERLTGQIFELKRQLELNQAASKKPRPHNYIGPLIIGMGLILSLISAAGLFLTPGQWGIWPILLLSAGLGLVIAGLISAKADVSSKNTAANNDLSRASEALANCRQTISDITGDLDLDAFRNKVYSFEAARQRRVNLEQEAARLMEDENEDILRAELSEIALKMVNLQAELTLIPADINEEQFAGFVRQQAVQKEQLNISQIELAKVRTAIADFEHYALKNQDRWKLENALPEKKAELETLTLKKNGIAEAVKVLQESWKEVQSGMAPLVGERASRIISGITDKKYLHIEPEIKQTEFKFVATSEGSDDTSDPDLLSAGTRDQVYLALRLAIAEFLAQGKRFPLILDDPFINFDEVRLKNTVDLLAEIAGQHQVIMFTKDPGFSNAVSLDKY